MKFEIDDKTGRFNTLGFSLNELSSVKPTTIEEFEAILQAVKKTQEKILNKQIQEIQDSKNLRKYGSSKYASRESVSTDNTIGIQKGKLRPDEKIAQNQKIVDGIELIITTAIKQKERLEPLVKDKLNNYGDISQKALLRNNILLDGLIPLWHSVTGKDIKELS